MKLRIGRPGRAPSDDAGQQSDDSDGTTVVIVSGACCFPPLRAFDLEAGRVVDAAITEVGLPARVVSMSTSQAYYGGLPRALAEEGKRVRDTVGITAFPAVLVNLELVSYGVPTLEAVVAALRKAAGSSADIEAAAVATSGPQTGGTR